jgi:hypothetical protein
VRTGGALHFEGEFRSDVMGAGFVYSHDIERDGGGPLDAPEIMPAGAMGRMEHWNGLVGYAWAEPELFSRWML